MTPVTIKLPAELFALAESSEFQGDVQLDELAIGPDDYRFDEPAHWRVTVTNTGSAFLLEGDVQAEATCACARCLEDVNVSLDGSIEGYLLMSDSDLPAVAEDEDDEIGEDEFDVLSEDHVLDLYPYIASALMVEAPAVPLCSEDCRGLCPSCGANLNEGECNCGGDAALAEFEKASNPFAALADYSFE